MWTGKSPMPTILHNFIFAICKSLASLILRHDDVVFMFLMLGHNRYTHGHLLKE